MPLSDAELQVINNDFNAGLIGFHYEDRVLAGLPTSVQILTGRTGQVVGELYGIYTDGLSSTPHDFGASWYRSPRGEVFGEPPTSLPPPPPPPPPDGPIVVSIVAPIATPEGGDGAFTTLTFRVTLDRPFSTGSLTALVELQGNKPVPYENALHGLDWIRAPAGPTDPFQALVTFAPNQTSADVAVAVLGDHLIEPNEIITAQLSSLNNSTGQLAVINLVGADSATATISNDDGALQTDVIITGVDALGPEFGNYVRQDVQAAIARIEAALGARLPRLEIGVQLGLPAGVDLTTLAHGAPQTDPETLLPAALREARGLGDWNRDASDIIISLATDVLRRAYSGGRPAPEDIGKPPVDMTELLSHEILHGLGFGAPGPHWNNTLVSQDRSTYIGALGVAYAAANGLALANNGIPLAQLGTHIAPSNPDLMNPVDNSLVKDAVSGLDAAILRDLGYGTRRGFFVQSIGTDDGESLQGSAEADRLEGRAGNDRLEGNGGIDALLGEDGDDQLLGGNGDDQMIGGAGLDLMLGGDGGDFMDGGDGNDRLEGGADNDTLVGVEGIDLLMADDGDDQIYGGPGGDRLEGGAGRDALAAHEGDDQMDGGQGDDWMFGGAGLDQLVGGDGFDLLVGDGGADRLDGGAGNDQLYGYDGDDIIIGGAGNDDMNGGAGNDLFLFEAGFGQDTIYGFAAGTGSEDRIQFSGGGMPTTLAEVLTRATQGGLGTVITIDNNTSLTLQGVAVASLSADDFRFG